MGARGLEALLSTCCCERINFFEVSVVVVVVIVVVVVDLNAMMQFSRTDRMFYDSIDQNSRTELLSHEDFCISIR